MQRKNEKEQQYTLWPQFDAYVKKVVATANCGFGRTLKKHCKEFEQAVYFTDKIQIYLTSLFIKEVQIRKTIFNYNIG